MFVLLVSCLLTRFSARILLIPQYLGLNVHSCSIATRTPSLADKLSQIQKTPLFDHWRDTLHILSVHTRPNLLRDINTLTPVIFTLDGQQAVKYTALAIQDVSHWWG